MRLIPDQRDRIVRTIRDRVGEDATIWLYGSRTADNRRGGDVDLLVRTSAVIDVRVERHRAARGDVGPCFSDDAVKPPCSVIGRDP